MGCYDCIVSVEYELINEVILSFYTCTHQGLMDTDEENLFIFLTRYTKQSRTTAFRNTEVMSPTFPDSLKRIFHILFVLLTNELGFLFSSRNKIQVWNLLLFVVL